MRKTSGLKPFSGIWKHTKMCFFSFIIFLQLWWTIETKSSQVCYLMHGKFGHIKWEYWSLTIQKLPNVSSALMVDIINKNSFGEFLWVLVLEKGGKGCLKPFMMFHFNCNCDEIYMFPTKRSLIKNSFGAFVGVLVLEKGWFMMFHFNCNCDDIYVSHKIF